MTEAKNAHHPTRVESEFISMTRFLMIVGLTFHHMFSIPGSAFFPRDPIQNYTHFVPDLINGFFHMAFMAAVPALSVISGFLFFRRSHVDFVRLLKGRFFTVALPSWLWTAMWLLFAFVLYRAGRESGAFSWLNYDFDAFSPKVLVNGIFGYDKLPFALQFWFVHDLILTLALSPLIYWLLRTLKGIFLVLTFGVWLSGYVPPPFFSLNVLFFFSLGASLGLPSGLGLQAILTNLERFGWYVVPVFVLALFVRLFAHEFPGVTSVISGETYLSLLRLLGILSFAHMIDVLRKQDGRLKRLLIHYSGYSFFVFSAHYPLILFVAGAALRIPGHDSYTGYFLMWFGIPLATVILCIVAAKVLERLASPVFNLLNGGRSGHGAHQRLTAKGAG